MSRSRRWEDPFEGRDNFPMFDEALSSAKKDRSSDNNNVDQSMCSTASSAALSIGARAALNEHMRHVAKYGLDDSQYGARMMMEENFSPQRRQNPLDEAWEKLVDTSNNNHILHSSSSSHANENSFLSLADLRLAPTTQAGGEGEGIEVMAAADQSSDYFNTSKVMLLQTPERNRSRQIRAVTSRQDGSEEDSFGSDNDDSPPMMHLFQQHVMAQQSAPAADLSSHFSEVGGGGGTPGRDHSFVSLSAVDLSRISAEGSEVHAQTTTSTRPSPDSSFALQDQCTTILEVPPPDASRSRPDAPLASTISPLSLTATFRPSPPRPQGPRTFPPAWSPPKKSTPSSSHYHYKENDHHAPNFAEALGFSPIGSRAAKSVARTTKNSSSSTTSRRRQSEQRLSSKSLFTDSSHQQQQQRQPSSIHTSPALLPDSSSTSLRPRRRSQQLSGGSMVVEYNNSNNSLTDDNISPLHSSSEHKKNGSMMSASLSSSNSNSLNRSTFLVGDRRFYRTVVPSRVFWKEPEDYFPEQYDSFSVPQPSSSNKSEYDMRTVKTEP